MLLTRLILDFLFPKYCVNCGTEGESVCFLCSGKIIPVVSQICPVCEKLSPGGEYHKNCRKGKSLKGIVCATYFREGPIREMIHNLKYNGVEELVELLAKMMTDTLKDNFKFLNSNFESNSNDLILKHSVINNSFKIQNSDFIICFVPMHISRRAARGYNHAELLARQIGKNLNLKVEDLLIKKTKTRRQAELSGIARRANLSGAFILKSDTCIKNRKIIIVDDVTTTGSTLNECAKVLHLAGAKEVWGLVISRG
jgi:competence protein ComFC